MNIWVIIPIKSLSETKSRLSSILSPSERSALTLYFYTRLLKVVKQVEIIDEVLVVSRDEKIGHIANKLRIRAIQEKEDAGLNESVRLGCLTAQKNGATHCLILPSDLPLVTKADLEHLFSKTNAATLLICGDGKQMGTNALFLPMAKGFQFRYGSNSFEQHLTEAKRVNLATEVFINSNLQFDLDTEEDWEQYQFMLPSSNL